MKRFLCALLAAFLIIGCCGALTASAQTTALDAYCLTVQPGSDVTSLNFNWITRGAPKESALEIAPASENFETAKRKVVGTNAQTVFSGTAESGESVRLFSNKVTVTDLEPNTSYTYRIGNGEQWSETYTIHTGRSNRVTAYIVSDVHIISSEVKLPLQNSIDGWEQTLNQLKDLDEADLILSIGDQMQNSTRLDYLEGFFDHSLLAEFALAPIDGNHDISPASSNWPSFTNVPNSTAGGSKNGIGDYFFKQGNVLFVMLSLTDINLADKTHEKVFKEAIKAYPDYDWLVVGLHESIYGMYMYNQSGIGADEVEDHHDSVYSDHIELIEKYNVDIVLTGHSHNYSRSHFMKDGEVQEVEQNDEGAYVDPNGTVWVEMGTAHHTGKWSLGQSAKPGFPWPWLDYYYSPSIGVCSYAVLETRGNSLTLTGFKLLEEDEVLDTLTIVKSSAGLSKDEPPAPEGGNENTEDEPNTPTPPADQNNNNDTGNGNEESKGGCGAIVNGSAISLLCLASASTAVMIKRKKEKASKSR